MTTKYKNALELINSRLGNRKLVWFGTRGTDSRALLGINNFKELFSLIAPLNSISLNKEVCLETKKKLRVDLDSYSIDYDDTPDALDLRRQLFFSLADQSYLVSYRPSNFLTSIYFPRSKSVEYLGLFHESQEPFEHKPWVESELKKVGVNIVPWTYVEEKDRNLLEEMLQTGPQVIRSSRSDGGAGLALIHDPAELDLKSVPHPDHFLGVAPFLSPSIPLNVNAVAFPDGTVTLHSPSLQLIGIRSCTRRTFGYCGNDFARLGDLSDKILDELEEYVIKSGRWLASKGYLGAFGIDAIVFRDRVYVAEINPRFQGSSDLSSWIDLDMQRPDMFLDHIAAFLGIEPRQDNVHLKDLAKDQMKVSQIICHNISESYLQRNEQPLPIKAVVDHYELVPASRIAVAPEAILFRAVANGSVTEDGNSLITKYNDEIQSTVKVLFDINS
ncbi:MAG: Uncharacterized protein FD146_2409 [Anaerolineaceae bacterium]|nr:MAG: Uncharacterized protein FD146_2409 [Anaerolineaceae bacterium]